MDANAKIANAKGDGCTGLHMETKTGVGGSDDNVPKTSTNRRSDGEYTRRSRSRTSADMHGIVHKSTKDTLWPMPRSLLPHLSFSSQPIVLLLFTLSVALGECLPCTRPARYFYDDFPGLSPQVHHHL